MLAVFVGSWQAGVFGLLGAAVATAAAYAMGVDRRTIDMGTQGFSGCVTGIALYIFLGPHPSTYLLTIGGAVVCVLAFAALTAVLAPWKLPVLTAPFCVVVGVVLAAAPAFTRVWPGGSVAALPIAAAPGMEYTWTDLWHGFFANISQVGLSAHWYVGAIMLVGLFVGGIRYGLAAIAGSAVAVLLAWALGAPCGRGRRGCLRLQRGPGGGRHGRHVPGQDGAERALHAGGGGRHDGADGCRERLLHAVRRTHAQLALHRHDLAVPRRGHVPLPDPAYDLTDRRTT